MGLMAGVGAVEYVSFVPLFGVWRENNIAEGYQFLTAAVYARNKLCAGFDNAFMSPRTHRSAQRSLLYHCILYVTHYLDCVEHIRDAQASDNYEQQ